MKSDHTPRLLMKTPFILRAVLLASLAVSTLSHAQQPAPAPAAPAAEKQLTPEEMKKKIEERVAEIEKLGWTRQGIGALGDKAQIQIPKDWRFTGSESTRKLMVMYGNPATNRELGMLAVEGIGDPPWIIFEFDPSGYVKDDEKDSLDADALLQSLKDGQIAGNEYRIKQGMDGLEVLGWAIPPRYNPTTNNLEWATKIKSIGAPADAISINFNTRLLGRKGVMEVTLVCEPEELNDMIAAQEKILTGYSYIEGERYAEFKSGDKIAEYGLTALIAGGGAFALAKTGLLGKLGLMFAKLGKVAYLLVIGVLVGIKKLFGKLFGARTQE